MIRAHVVALVVAAVVASMASAQLTAEFPFLERNAEIMTGFEVEFFSTSADGWDYDTPVAEFTCDAGTPHPIHLHMVGEVEQHAHGPGGGSGAKLEVKTDPVPLHDGHRVVRHLQLIREIFQALKDDAAPTKRSTRFHHNDCTMDVKIKKHSDGRNYKDEGGHDLPFKFALKDVASIQTSVGLPIDFFLAKCQRSLNTFFEATTGYPISKHNANGLFRDLPRDLSEREERGYIYHDIMCRDYDIQFGLGASKEARAALHAKDLHAVLPRIMMDSKSGPHKEDRCHRYLTVGWNKYTGEEDRCPNLGDSLGGKFIPCFLLGDALGFVLELRKDQAGINAMVRNFVSAPTTSVNSMLTAIEDLQFVVNRVWTTCSTDSTIADQRKFQTMRNMRGRHVPLPRLQPRDDRNRDRDHDRDPQ